MASRKKKEEQTSLFAFPTMTTPKGESEAPPAVVADAPVKASALPVVVDAERKLVPVHLTQSGPDEDVIVEPVSHGRFLVSTLRARGTTVAAVYYSRKQLEMLLARIPSALEIA